MNLTKSKYQNIILILLIILMITYSHVNSIIRAGISGLFICFITTNLFWNFKFKQNKKTYYIYTLCILCSFIMFFRNTDIENGFYGRALYFIVPMIFMLCIQKELYWVPKSIKILYVCSLLAVLISSTMILQGVEQLPGDLLLFVIFGLGYSFSNVLFQKKHKRIISFSMFLMFLAILLISGKRGHLLFGACSILFICYVFSSKPIRFICNLGGILSIIFLSFFLFITGYASHLLMLFTDEFTNGRMTLYKNAFDLWIKHPWIGSGWGSFRNIVQITSSSLYMDVHNVYFQLLCEVGILGLIIFILFFSFFILIGLKAIYINKKHKIDSQLDIYLCIAMYGQCFFLLYCFTGNPMYDFYYYSYYIINCIITLIIYNKLTLKM